MTFHDKPSDQVLQNFGVDKTIGLSSEKVKELSAQYGPNKLREKKKKSFFMKFLDQFKDVMILILIVAAAISFVLACLGHDAKEFFEPALILIIVIALFVLITGGLFFYLSGLGAVDKGNEDPVIVNIPQGSGASYIVEILD